METYSNIWKALNQTTLKGLDEEIAHYPAEIEIKRPQVVRHFRTTSQYKFIDLASLSEEDEQFLETVGLSLNYLRLNQRKVINSEGVSPETHKTTVGSLALHLSMVEERFIYAICPSTGKVLKSNRSLPINRFISSCAYRFVGNEVFYLILRKLDHFVKNFLYFPRLDLIVIFERCGPGNKRQEEISFDINFLKINTVFFWKQLRLYLLKSDEAQTCVIAHNVSILHYIKNMLTGIQKLLDEQYLQKVDKFLVFGSEFCGGFDEIFPEISSDKIKRVKVSVDAFGGDAFGAVIKNNYFVFRVFYISCEKTKKIKGDFIQRLIQLCLNKSSKICLHKIAEARRKHFPLLWINVRATRRVWLSQVEGTANIIKDLYSHFPNLGVVFDGFTRQEIGGKVVFNPGYEEVIEEENKLVNKIQSLLPKEIQTYNNIGCFIHESLLWAETIDLSMETLGSSEVRTMIFNKPKFIHGSNILMGKNALDGVVDVNESHPQTDYDFDWQIAYQKLFKIASELKRDQRPYSQYSNKTKTTFLSHRGLWKTKAEQNSLAAFKHSFEQGFGCELDIRTQNGQLVISHDVPTQSCLTLEELFQTYNTINQNVPIAINIKADGLQQLLKEQIEKYAITNYFVFDMSIPDTLGYQKHQLKYFTRQSEYEPQPIFYDQAEGVWLDCFNSDWWTVEDVEKHLQHNKFVVLVSPELHKREYQQAWETWRTIERELNTDKLMLCTDFPQQAQEFFNDNH